MVTRNDAAGGNKGLGRRTSMTDGLGNTAWLYDARGRVTKETKTIAGSGNFITEWGYDAADRLAWLKYPGSPVEQVNYTYNPRGLLETVTGDSIYVADTVYNALGG